MAHPAATSTETGEQPRVEPGSERDDWVRCSRCRHQITNRSLAVQRAGAHEHTFRNPAGYSWRIACFRDAAGCGSMGELTTEATWFAGFAWCYAQCTGCQRHLGWWFVGDGPSFVGLIITRLT